MPSQDNANTCNSTVSVPVGILSKKINTKKNSTECSSASHSKVVTADTISVQNKKKTHNLRSSRFRFGFYKIRSQPNYRTYNFDLPFTLFSSLLNPWKLKKRFLRKWQHSDIIEHGTYFRRSEAMEFSKKGGTIFLSYLALTMWCVQACLKIPAHGTVFCRKLG